MSFALLLLLAAPFSHKLHLRMVPQCTTCHARAAASTGASDSLLPDKVVCTGCHKPQPPEFQHAANPARQGPAPLAHFSHAVHLKLGNIAPRIAAAIDSGAYLSPSTGFRAALTTTNPCVACHRGLEQSDAVTATAFPQMADCLVCHNQIDPPESCSYCHNAGAHLAPASHTDDWEDVHSSGKVRFDKRSCAVCHGRRFHCEGCH